MARKRNSDGKDPARKNTLDRPAAKRKSQVGAPQTVERQIGQYTAEGTPSLQKK
jgi:hypothetical protein